jgi:hypothetical protein
MVQIERCGEHPLTKRDVWQCRDYGHPGVSRTQVRHYGFSRGSGVGAGWSGGGPQESQ